MTSATSCATAENTSVEGAPDATSVATRRNAACSSTSRCSATLSSLRGSAGGADVPITSRYPIIVALSTNVTRVVLADDEVLMREGLAGLLERAGFDVVGQSGNASDLVDLVRELRPDLVIVDIRMPPTHTTEGLDAAETIREEFPATAVVALSAYVQVERAT